MPDLLLAAFTRPRSNDCCSRLICRGCDFANQKRESEEWLERRCPCCQEQMSESFGEEINTYFLNRAKKNDAYAMNRVGLMHYNKGDCNEALEYWINASELGDVYAHYYLAAVYLGQGVEKDEEKEVYHLEHAAIGGHPAARHYLGCKERDKGNAERAATNFIIAANLGYHASLKELQKLLANGHVSEEDYDAAVRAYRAAVDATKSPEREQAELCFTLFDLPESSSYGKCPICCLALPVDGFVDNSDGLL